MDQVINNIQYTSSPLGKVCMKHIIVLWKMVKNMFFLDSEHVEMMKWTPLPPPKKKIKLFVHVRCLDDDFFVAAVIRYAAKVYV